MTFAPRLVLLCCLLLSWASAEEAMRFRIWMAGQEVGGREVLRGSVGSREGFRTREWVRLERLGTAVEQRVDQAAFRDASGGIEFTWSIQLSQEPMEGRALWNPAGPRRLRVYSKDLPERVIDLEEGCLLWPGDSEARMREAAASRRSLSLKGYLPSLQQTTELTLQVVGADPLPGFPDAVRFRGTSREGAMQSDTELWVSPSVGEVKESSNLGGIQVLVQRTELPAPSGTKAPSGFFERTLKPLPPHPFLPWITSAALRWEGPGVPKLPEDEQQ